MYLPKKILFTMASRIRLVNCVYFIWLSLGDAVFLPNMYPRIRLEAKRHSPAGDPLILTPLLGNISQAQILSQVPLTSVMGFKSHAGFFTVDEKYKSNLYFWYFPAFSKKSDAPVVIWLQGGPGGSSLFGLFTEIGPIVATKTELQQRKYHWALKNHLIFIDNPVGTGFSYTTDQRGYCDNQECIATHLYEFLHQFFTLFPDLRKNDLYITGESYAGKYIPSLGYEIHRQNRFAKEKIYLKGMAIGNGYCDPVNQMNYGEYLYQLGLIDIQERILFQKLEHQIQVQIKEKNWAKADILMDQLMDGEINNYSYYKNFTGFEYYYNFLITKYSPDMTIFAQYLADDKVRRAMHVGGMPFNSGSMVQLHLAFDILKSVSPAICQLLSHYRILFYNGQLDVVVAYPLTENFLRNLNFTSADEYKRAKRKIWMVGNTIAGYVKIAGNLTEVLVRNAGHMVPHDQPKWSLDLITRFIENSL